MIDIVELRSYNNKITFSANLHVGQRSVVSLLNNRNKERNYSRAKFNLRNTSLNKVIDTFTWHETLAHYHLSVVEYQTPVTMMPSLQLITQRSEIASSFDREFDVHMLLLKGEGCYACFIFFQGSVRRVIKFVTHCENTANITYTTIMHRKIWIRWNRKIVNIMLTRT
jgi:hypothetical protein